MINKINLYKLYFFSFLFFILFNLYESTFRFSVIISIYNTGKYLDDSIGSLLNQSINFNENIQIAQIIAKKSALITEINTLKI